MQNLFIMKNRLFTILPILLMFLSTNAFCVLDIICVAALSVTGTSQVAELQAGEQATFFWHDDYNDDDIQYVLFYYQEASTAGYNPANDTYIGPGLHSSGESSAESDLPNNPNHIDWTPPYNSNGLYITVCEYLNPTNRRSLSCNVAPSSAKNGSLAYTFKPYEINFYPNPVINELNIQAGEKTINSVRLYDLKGNSVGNYKFNQSYQETIDVSALPSGTYVAIINEEEQVKIVKR